PGARRAGAVSRACRACCRGPPGLRAKRIRTHLVDRHPQARASGRIDRRIRRSRSVAIHSPLRVIQRGHMTDPIQQRVRTAASAALDKKAFDLDILAVSELTSIADYFLLCSASSERQTQAIADHVLEKVRREEGVKPLRGEATRPGRGILVD